MCEHLARFSGRADLEANRLGGGLLLVSVSQLSETQSSIGAPATRGKSVGCSNLKVFSVSAFSAPAPPTTSSRFWSRQQSDKRHRYVRFGSLADIGVVPFDVHLAPNDGHPSAPVVVMTPQLF